MLPTEDIETLVTRVAQKVFPRSEMCRRLLKFLLTDVGPKGAGNKAASEAFYAKISTTVGDPYTAFNKLKSAANKELKTYFQTEGLAEPITFTIDVQNIVKPDLRAHPQPITPSPDGNDLGSLMIRSLHGSRGPLVVAYTEIVLYYNKETGLLRDSAGDMIAPPNEVELRYAVGRCDLEAVALLWDLSAKDPQIPHELVRANLWDLRMLLTKSSVIFLGSPFDRGDYVKVVESSRYAFRVRSTERKIELVSISETGESRLDSTALFGQHKDGKEFAIVKRFTTGHGTDLLLLAGTDTTSTMAVVEMFFRTTPGHLKHLRQILGPRLDPHRHFERALELVSNGQTAHIKRVLPLRRA